MTETATLTLADFLLARIAADEAKARETWERPHWATCDTQGDYGSLGDECDCGLPARVLAECAAKRAIVERTQQSGEFAVSVYETFAEMEADVRGQVERASYTATGNAWYQALELLAQPYADHEDFREEWRV